MKILFFTNEYSHPSLPAHGGVGTYFKIMARELIEKGYQVYIYGFSKKEYKLNDDGTEIVFFKQYFNKYPIVNLCRSLSKSFKLKSLELYFLKKERQYLAKKLKSYAFSKQIDIIQSFTFNGFTAYWDNSIPLVTRFHGSLGFWHYYLGHEKNSNKILMEKKSLQLTPYTVANSNFSAKFIKEYYDVNVDTVIPNGIDTNIFCPNNDIEQIPKSIFYAGTLSKAKGVDKLASIFNEIVIKHPEATLHLIGRGSKFLKYLTSDVLSENALKNIKFYGQIPLSKLPALLSKASIITIPSKGETFGFTIVEAMALEKITIVSNIPVASEIITHNVDGFIANDFNDFKDFILKVFAEPEKFEDMKLNARKTILEKYTKKIMVEQSIDYYKKIVNIK